MESAVVLSLFEFLLAGLVCTVLVCAAWTNRGRAGERRSFLLLACAFLLLSGHLLFDVFESYLALSHPTARVQWPRLEPFIEALEMGAVALLLACYRPSTWFAASPILAAALSATCRLIQPAGGDSAWPAYVWGAEQALMLVSLALFALVFERRARSLYISIFVRLDLIFVVIASLLVLVVTYAERAQLTRFEQMRLEEVSEFLRGQALRSYIQGRSADLVVTDPAITRKVVSEFGNLPDLRRVRVKIHERTMEMAIRRDGMVSQTVWAGGADPPAVHPVDGERLATLAHTPIRHQGRLIGHIELDEDLGRLDAAIAWQISRIFLVFTALVFLSGGLIGLTVRSANRTIERQCEEIERANQQLLQAARLASVGELAGGIAHEINNPAGIITARADYMLAIRGQDGADAELSEGIMVVRNQAERISEIVRGLLTFSRPSQPRITRSVDLKEILERSLNLVGPRANAAGIRVTSGFEDGLPAVRADSNQIGQVFVNVLNNAIDAMPQGGQLAVRAGFGEPGTVFVSFADTGCGIAAEHLPKVFDPFFTTKPPGRGTGLGLAISYGIIRDHGGEIHVSSGVDRGTTFTILLPVRM